MKFLLTLFCLLSALCVEAQINLYVAPTGNDNTGNGSIGTPYATIGKAATVANTGSTNINSAVTIWVRGGTYRNVGFTTTSTLPVIYDPQNVGEAIWKISTVEVVRLNNINRTLSTKITIKAYTGETPILEGDGDNSFTIRNCSYISVEGLEIVGVVDRIPKQLAWLYWGTYRYTSGGNTIYGDRKTDICAQYGFSPCSDIPPNVFVTGTTDYPTYKNLPNINSLNVERPNIFGGKGLLVQLSNHIDIIGCNIHHFPGGGLRATQSDYVTFKNNLVHHNTSRSSVGTHGLVIEGLSDDSGDNLTGIKMLISGNTVYSNYNEIYSWVQSKTICTTEIDEGKGICLLRTSPNLVPPSGFSGTIRVENNISYDNGKSGIHANDMDRAEIFNNTVYSNAHTNINDPSIASTGTNAGISVQSSTNITINNNIVVVPTGFTPALVALAKCQTGCETESLSNNLIYGGDNEYGTGSTTADPKFTNMAGNVVTLQSSSPAINQGTKVTGQFATTDFLGNTRDANPDIGAYEYQSVLPVEFLDFQLVQQETAIHLLWQTASEKKNKGFEIERSADSQLWQKIGTVKGVNNKTAQNYAFIDDEPLQGINYYRLKQLDTEGGATYSKVLSATRKTKQKQLVYPNPFSQTLVVEGVEQGDVIQIFDAIGREVSAVKIETTLANRFEINTLSLQSHSFYFLKIGDQQHKIIKN